MTGYETKLPGGEWDPTKKLQLKFRMTEPKVTVKIRAVNIAGPGPKTRVRLTRSQAGILTTG